MSDPLAEIEARIQRKREIVDALAGRSIESAVLTDLPEDDESSETYRERLTLTFANGSRVVIESVDFEEYRSWLNVTEESA
jgi:Trm5-related predicted tRNA methylase